MRFFPFWLGFRQRARPFDYAQGYGSLNPQIIKEQLPTGAGTVGRRHERRTHLGPDTQVNLIVAHGGLAVCDGDHRC